MADDEVWTAHQVKEYVEAILNEKDRALAMADDEREKAASALRGEQQRALDQAGREREKAAEALRIELARAMHEGDDRLREHISNQVMQINAALTSADKLELERLGRALDGLTALSVKLDVIRETDALAREKFEATAERDKEKQNEFRGSLDDLSQRMALRRDMEERDGALGNRIDEVQTQLGELRSRLDVGPAGLTALQRSVDTSGGRSQGISMSAGVLAGSLAALATVLTVVILLARALGH